MRMRLSLQRSKLFARKPGWNLLKNAMMDLGITGMTVSHVLGCGIQKGKPEYYRGVPVVATLLPKVQVEIVISQVPVRSVIEAAKKIPFTPDISATARSSFTMWKTSSRFVPVRKATMPFKM